MPHNTEGIKHVYKSKYNLTRETQVILLMITDGEKCHYLAVKSLSALFREITGNMEDVTDVDYRHGKKVFEYLINKTLGDYHDLYVQSDTLLLADVFENYRNMCIKLYELDLRLD